MTTRRVVALLLPPLDGEAGRPEPLLRALADLAQHSGSTLHVVEVMASLAEVPPGLRTCAGLDSWTQVVHPAASALNAQALVALSAQALASEGLPDTPILCVLAPGQPMEEVQARLAARLQAHTVGRCTSLQIDGDAVVAHRASWGGRAEATLRCTSKRVFAVWRGPDLPPAQPAADSGQPVEVRHHVVDLVLPEPAAVELLPVDDRAPPLDGARKVVSGGRGMAGPDGIALLARLAAALGASLGGSLPTIDAGWLQVARQVGQSGRFVHPRWYLAVGISGTPQHLAGISSETRILAVNNDAQAPIFAVADVGVVADWRTLLPALLGQLGEPPPG